MNTKDITSRLNKLSINHSDVTIFRSYWYMNIGEEDEFVPGMPEYQWLEKIGTNEQRWEQFITDMLIVGVQVEYDSVEDVYKFNGQMP